jgi:hypothetical protein
MAAQAQPLPAPDTEYLVTAERAAVEGDGREYLTGTYPSFLRALRVAEMLEACGWDTNITESP